MTSERKYDGKGHSARNSSQTVNSDPQTAQSQPTPYVEMLDSAYQDLAVTVEGLLYQGENTTPVEVINELLLFWLETNHCDHSNPLHAERLRIALETVNCLHKLIHRLESVQLFQSRVCVVGKGVSNG